MMNPFPRKLSFYPKLWGPIKRPWFTTSQVLAFDSDFRWKNPLIGFLIRIVVLQCHGPDVCTISDKILLTPRKALLFQNYDQKILNYTSWRSSLKIDHLLFLQVSWAAQDDGTPCRTERKKYAPLIYAGERKFNSNLQAVMYGKANSPFIKIRENK